MSTKASFSTILFYGVGSISPAIKNNLLSSFLFYYYNQVLGLSPWLVSFALAIALVVDAATDPIVGYASDHTASRWGRRHPYIYFSLIPSSLFYFFLIMADFGDGQLMLFLQLLTLVTGLRVAWTFFQVPREALGAELSKDYAQRNTLNGLSSFFGWIGGAGIAYVTNAYFLGGSYDNAAGYQTLAYWGCAIILLASVVFALGTHRNIPELMVAEKRSPPNFREIWAEILETLNHRSWLVLFFAGVVFSIYIGLTTGLGIYFNRFFWDWSPSDIALFAIADLSAALVVSAFAGILARGWDKKKLATGLFVISIVVGPILLIGRLSDLWLGTSLMPANGEQYGALWWVMLVHSVFMAAIGVLAWVLVGSMTADVVEDSQTKTGKRSEGLFFAGPNLIQKCISGIGFIIKGGILTLVGFSDAATEAEKVAAVEWLAFTVALLSVFLPALALWIFSKYDITQSVHEANLLELGYEEGTERAVTSPTPSGGTG
ncbi:MAG: MFS transporter [Pseudomonadota bacterium]